MKRKFILMEMTVAVVLGCVLVTWIFDGSLEWLARLPARLAAEQPVQQYSIAVLNWGVAGRVRDINNAGLAVGVAADREGRMYAALWQDGQTSNCYNINDGYGSEAVSITEDGAVAISVGTHRQDISISYLRLPGGEFIYLNDLLPGTRQCNVIDMNSDYIAVGMAETENETWLPWVWSADRGMQVFNEKSTTVTTINSGGMIAAMDCTRSASGSPRVWTPAADGGYTLMDPPGPNLFEGRPYAINSDGLVVGRLFGPRPMRWDAQTGLTALPGLNGTQAGWALDVNDQGDIVGCLTGCEGGMAVLWRDGKAHDLNKCIPQDLGWQLVEATAINDEGVIACRAVSEQEGATSLLLMPVKEQQMAQR